MGGEEDAAASESSNPSAASRRPYWRSQSWSASRSSTAVDRDGPVDSAGKNAFDGRPLPLPLTPRSQQNFKARSCLPPLQPLSIARRSVDEWPKAGSDDVGEWPQPPTPSARLDKLKSTEDLKVDLSLLRSEGKRSQIAFFDKECSKVADHIYLGGDAVARNREILRKNGITHVLNCVGFVCPEYFKSDLVYKTLWLQDSPSEDITSILYDVFDYFEDVREQGGRVLVHCCQGVSRSTSLVIAYLMWRKGQSFEDAFDFVKAARGIANPNMGFACQLLQCQKRVHAIPLSPNSVLRMYRMAPHSPYDALHLVPKMLNDPSPMALDSRGAFILHVLSSIYVWIGKNCEPVMEKDAKAAALQVVRYERVPGPVVCVEEGDEPLDFWEAFLRVPLLSDSMAKINKEQVHSGTNIVPGKRKVEAYNADFELFYKGLTGGVVPPFSSAGAGYETHLPARESNWSILRRKFISGGMKGWVSASKAAISRVYSDSVLARDTDSYVNRAQLLSVESSTSPPYLSPSSLYSDSSNSSRSSSDSPSVSPSTNSPSITPMRPTNPLQNSMENPNMCQQAVPSPSKGFARSLAERRKNFSSTLKLPTFTDDPSRPSTVISKAPVNSIVVPQGLSEDKINQPTNGSTSDNAVHIGLVSVGKSTSENAEQHGNLAGSSVLPDRSLCSLAGLTDGSEESNLACTLAYCWPDFKKIETFSRDNLDSKSVFLFLALDKSSGSSKARKLYVWIGSHSRRDNELVGANGGRDVRKNKDVDWNHVGFDFLNSMDLPRDIPIKVVREEEPDDLLELLNSL